MEPIVEGKQFGDGEFGFFSHLGERWPRGQSSALMICAELMTPGAWSNCFNDPMHADRERGGPSLILIPFVALLLSDLCPKAGTLPQASPSRPLWESTSRRSV
eukprot:SAG11_NODE_1117_length_5798_cov_10.203194_7_plen_103_part_00